jgi:U3 small nucleolar RNA-associated protein 22
VQREGILLDKVISGEDKLLPHIRALAAKKEKERKGKEWHEAVFAKDVYVRRFVHLPRHHRSIAALFHRYAAYAGTVRLVKRWLGAHWVLAPSSSSVQGRGKVSAEAVELLCARVFVRDGRGVSWDVDSDLAVQEPVPGTKERGFACVVEFLKEWKWEEGMFVPLYGGHEKESAAEGDDESEGNELKRSKADKKQVQVTASSTSAWTISTEMDKEGKMWTANGPDVVVAHRIKALAKATWDYLQNVEKGSLDVHVNISFGTVFKVTN